MKITRDQALFTLNLSAMMVLYVGYILTTGLDVLPEGFRTFARISAATLAVAAIFAGRRATTPFFFSIFVFGTMFVANSNAINLNLIFLALSAQALTSLTARRAALVLLFTAITGVAIHLAAQAAGLAETVTTSVGGRQRSASGFSNANQAALIYLSFAASAFLVHSRYRSRRSMFVVVASLLIALQFILASDSRTSLLSLVIIAALYVPLSWIKDDGRRSPVIGLAVAAMPFACALVTWWITYSNSPEMNALLSLRPYFFNLFTVGVTTSEWFWGWPLGEFENVDNSYLTLLSASGAVLMVSIAFVTAWNLFQVKPREASIAISALIAGIFESFLIRPEILLTSVFFAVLLWHRCKPEQSEVT